jgi:hypothetical protein
MDTVTRVAEAMQRVLGSVADRQGKESGFIKRLRKFRGSTFVQTLVFGWLANGEASLGEMNQAAASVGVEVSEQGIDKRFTPEAAVFMEAEVKAAVAEVIASEPVAIEVFQRFNGVYLRDSTVIGLPTALATIWSGCGGSRGETAALKVQVELNFSTGALTELELRPGREHDSQAMGKSLPRRSLNIRDLGYYALDRLQADEENGRFFLTRHKTNTVIYEEKGNRFDLGAWLKALRSDCTERHIQLGAQHRIACRLIVARVSPEKAAAVRRKLKRAAQKRGQTLSAARLALADWVIYITNVPTAMLSLDEALVLVRVRWQIELLFKLWKSDGHLDKSRSENPWRVLCEVYAKLIALIIQHWIFLTSCWLYPDRSLTKAAQTVRKFAFAIADAFSNFDRLCTTIQTIQRCLAAGCRLNPRSTHPNTCQLLFGLECDA